jgi:hypothetical protein
MSSDSDINFDSDSDTSKVKVTSKVKPKIKPESDSDSDSDVPMTVKKVESDADNDSDSDYEMDIPIKIKAEKKPKVPKVPNIHKVTQPQMDNPQILLKTDGYKLVDRLPGHLMTLQILQSILHKAILLQSLQEAIYATGLLCRAGMWKHTLNLLMEYSVKCTNSVVEPNISVRMANWGQEITNLIANGTKANKKKSIDDTKDYINTDIMKGKLYTILLATIYSKKTTIVADAADTAIVLAYELLTSKEYVDNLQKRHKFKEELLAWALAEFQQAWLMEDITRALTMAGIIEHDPDTVKELWNKILKLDPSVDKSITQLRYKQYTENIYTPEFNRLILYECIIRSIIIPKDISQLDMRPATKRIDPDGFDTGGKFLNYVFNEPLSLDARNWINWFHEYKIGNHVYKFYELVLDKHTQAGRGVDTVSQLREYVEKYRIKYDAGRHTIPDSCGGTSLKVPNDTVFQELINTHEITIDNPFKIHARRLHKLLVEGKITVKLGRKTVVAKRNNLSLVMQHLFLFRLRNHTFENNLKQESKMKEDKDDSDHDNANTPTKQELTNKRVASTAELDDNINTPVSNRKQLIARKKRLAIEKYSYKPTQIDNMEVVDSNLLFLPNKLKPVYNFIITTHKPGVRLNDDTVTPNLMVRVCDMDTMSKKIVSYDKKEYRDMDIPFQVWYDLLRPQFGLVGTGARWLSPHIIMRDLGHGNIPYHVMTSRISVDENNNTNDGSENTVDTIDNNNKESDVTNILHIDEERYGAQRLLTIANDVHFHRLVKNAHALHNERIWYNPKTMDQLLYNLFLQYILFIDNTTLQNMVWSEALDSVIAINTIAPTRVHPRQRKDYEEGSRLRLMLFSTPPNHRIWLDIFIYIVDNKTKLIDTLSSWHSIFLKNNDTKMLDLFFDYKLIKNRMALLKQHLLAASYDMYKDEIAKILKQKKQLENEKKIAAQIKQSGLLSNDDDIVFDD